MSWKLFAAAAFVVGCALLKVGAPLVPIVLGISLAGLLNFRQRVRLAKTQLKGAL
jgi:hypothetical protein